MLRAVVLAVDATGGIVWVILNDLFFSLLGFAVGVLSYREYIRWRREQEE